MAVRAFEISSAFSVTVSSSTCAERHRPGRARRGYVRSWRATSSAPARSPGRGRTAVEGLREMFVRGSAPRQRSRSRRTRPPSPGLAAAGWDDWATCSPHSTASSTRPASGRARFHTTRLAPHGHRAAAVRRAPGEIAGTGWRPLFGRLAGEAAQDFAIGVEELDHDLVCILLIEPGRAARSAPPRRRGGSGPPRRGRRHRTSTQRTTVRGERWGAAGKVHRPSGAETVRSSRIQKDLPWW